ncbi:MAG: hypothetical protein KKF41_01605, partial [Actinobacteria bacterium]|nr:hypothetical protein [Actinomycetota bacterium]
MRRPTLGSGDDAAHDFSCRVESTNNVDIVAERPMYFDYHGKWTGGSDVVGALSPAEAFYFAEGTTRPGFQPYLTIQNPGLACAEVKITYMKGDGTTQEQGLIVGAHSRSTVFVPDALGTGDDPSHDFSCKVECVNNRTNIVERPMYFDYQGEWTGGSTSTGPYRKIDRPNLCFRPLVHAVPGAPVSIERSRIVEYCYSFHEHRGWDVMLVTSSSMKIRRSTQLLAAVAFIAVVLLLTAPACFAQVRWQADGVAVCIEGSNQDGQQLCSDGMGGAIITWQDGRGANPLDIYAQRIDANGTPLWDPDGIVVCSEANNQQDPQITSDGVGGAIITWEDERTAVGAWDIYAQRVEADGGIHTGWAANGVAVADFALDQTDPQITTDGAEGAIIIWEDTGGANPIDIFAARIGADSTLPWAVGGVPICDEANNQENPQIISDGTGGAIITWQDERVLVFVSDIYSQRVDSGGAVQWTPDGIPICAAVNNQYNPQLTTDGSEGAIITWEDRRSGADLDVYAQRVLSGGTVDPAWDADGVVICDEGNDQQSAFLTTDGREGAILAWQDRRDPDWNIYSQKVDGQGVVQWTVNGVALTDNPEHQVLPRIVNDGCHGAIVTWQSGPAPNDDVYAQRVNFDGLPQWTAGGTLVGGAAARQLNPRITSDSQGGGIMVWQDERSGNWDVYAQKVSDYAQNWFLAEGSTGHSDEGYFETWVLVQNPGNNDATVSIDYLLPGGTVIPAAESPLALPAQSRDTVNVANTPGVDNQFSVSTTVTSDVPVIAERAMYWMPSDGIYRQAAHDSIGVTCPSYEWYLAEGSTGTNEYGTFETWVLVQNPGNNDATVNIDYLLPGGTVIPAAESPLVLPAQSRDTVSIASTPGAANQFSVSTVVEADQPIIAERAMYWNSADGTFRQAAHDSRGVTAPADTWFLAEGSTGHSDEGYFETWVLVQNPGNNDATVNIDYLLP